MQQYRFSPSLFFDTFQTTLDITVHKVRRSSDDFLLTLQLIVMVLTAPYSPQIKSLEPFEIILGCRMVTWAASQCDQILK